MKSFVAFPSAFQKSLLTQTTPVNSSGSIIPQCELFKKVAALNGSIVKCGIAADEAFSRFNMFRKMLPANAHQNMVAFEKHVSTRNIPLLQESKLQNKIDDNCIVIDDVYKAMAQKATKDNIEFLRGHVDDAIPNYLIENPELKIAYLEIDLDDYDSTMTSLEFFFPRIIENGVLVVNNYYKKSDEYKAVQDYFAHSRMIIHTFSVNNGPHYIVLD
jgi:hypothetical protein